MGTAPTGGLGAGGGGPPARLLVLTRNGWARGASYRVRLKPELEDQLGRSSGATQSLEWRVPETGAVAFDKTIPTRYDSSEAASNTLGGRFPGGLSLLFQGLLHDRVTGIAYARARWYDARNATWLSEDPLLDVDSPNLYAFVGWGPHQVTDPLGLESIRQWWDFDRDIAEGRKIEGYTQKGLYVAWNVLTFGFLERHEEDYERTGGYLGNRDAYLKETAQNLGRTTVEAAVTLGTGGAAGAGAKTLGGAVIRGAMGGAASGVAITGAVDLYERATGGEAMTREDYLRSVVSGAIFGGVGGGISRKVAARREATQMAAVPQRSDDLLQGGVGVNVSPEAWFAK
ncbi:MAG: RHS repeat-associated core domain-containing protein, partial [Anaerolineales bacterium]